MKTLRNLLLVFALLIPAAFAQNSFTFVLAKGTLTGNNLGINIAAVHVQAQIGQITAGNPLTAAYFRGDQCTNQDCYFTTDTFTGTWDNPTVTWQQLYKTTTYLITGTVSGVTNKGKTLTNVPVVIVVNKVVFTTNGFNN